MYLLPLICFVDVFEIYSPPPLQNKSNKLLKSHHSLEETIPPFDIPNVDICHDLESRLQYDPTYANSIMQYKLSVEVIYSSLFGL